MPECRLRGPVEWASRRVREREDTRRDLRDGSRARQTVSQRPARNGKSHHWFRAKKLGLTPDNQAPQRQRGLGRPCEAELSAQIAVRRNEDGGRP
jgi:hypothetical protein